jgi:hypothetical protein
MLRDRKALLEHEIHESKAEAAALYLDMIKNPEKISELRGQYEYVRGQTIDFEFDLITINKLIEQGHE